MQLKTLTFPYDVYSRHLITAQLIKNCRTILDVGGSLKELRHFLSVRTSLFTTDVIGGDVRYDGKKLPFRSHSVDAVVSLDTIEHISKGDRLAFITELSRVAKKKLIIAAPLGTLSHIAAEKRQQKLLKSQDKYLSEHIKYGLPSIIEIKHWLKYLPLHKLVFSGNYRTAAFLFRLHSSEIRLPKLGQLWFHCKKIISVIINLGLLPFEKSIGFSESVNRFYLIVNLK